jgi:membrane protein
VVLGIAALPYFVVFWWLSIWLLLGGRVQWRTLLLPAVVTGVFWLGMSVVFSFIFSGMVVSYTDKYGTIGTVFAFMSFLIAIGVVVMLGAAVGLAWHEARQSSRERPASQGRTAEMPAEAADVVVPVVAPRQKRPAS